MTDTPYTIGIDLGTTNCAVAYVARGREADVAPRIQSFAVPQLVAPGRLPVLPLPEGLSTAIAQCLRKRAAERPTNSRELEKALSVIPLDGLPEEYPHDIPRHSSDAPSSRSLPAPR